VLGDGKLELPLVYIDDVVDAILLAAKSPLHKGEVIQIIDPEHLTQEDVLGLAGGNKARAARRLGLSRYSLYRVLKRLGLEEEADAVEANAVATGRA